MKKSIVIFFVLILILSTAFIKNSTKRIDDEIYLIKESLRGLKKDFDNVKLEYDYLSSTEKLFEFQKLYFNDELVKKNIQEIKIIIKTSNEIEIGQLKFINE